MSHKIQWSAKKIILCLIVCFGLFEIGAFVISFALINKTERQVTFYTQSRLVNLYAKEIGMHYKEKLYDEAYGLIDILYSCKDYESIIYMIIVDENGEIIYPQNVALKKICVDLSSKSKYQKATIENRDFLVYIDSIPYSQNYIVGCFEKDYSNYAIDTIYSTLLFCNIAFIFAIIFIFWFYVLPKLARTLDKKKTIEWELTHAQELLQSAMPVGFPELNNAEIYTLIQPTKEVGGDLLDYCLINNKLYFVVGDVSDKGTLAAQMVMVTGTVLHTLMLEEKSVNDIMRELNSLYCRNEQYEMFCSLFIGEIDLDTLEMNFCNAGHEKALIIDSDGVRFMTQESNIVLGVFPDYMFESEHVQLKKDSLFIQYTDGITEAKNQKNKFFGMDRLLAWAEETSKRYQSKTAMEISESLLASVENFRKKAPQHDDIAILTLKFK